MLNYWIGFGLFIVLMVMSYKVNELRAYYDHMRRLAVADEDIRTLKWILFQAKCLVVFVWGSIAYVFACVIKFIFSWF